VIKIHKKPKIQKQDLNTSQDLFKVGDKVIVAHHLPKEVRIIIGTSISRFTGNVLYDLNNESTYYAGDLKKLNPTKQEARIACANREELCFVDLCGVFRQCVPEITKASPISSSIYYVGANNTCYGFVVGPIVQ
jgi:hypothetical protein